MLLVKFVKAKLAQSLFFSVFAIALFFVAPAAFADDVIKTKFEVTPNRCVTLRQGQPCFVRVNFQWSASEALQACLINVDGTQLKCWQLADKGDLVIPQNLPNTTEYVLVDNDGIEIGRASIVVSWVYRKKRSKRRWRLF